MTTREFVDKWELDTLTIVDIEASDTLIARIDEREAAFRATVAAALAELRAETVRLLCLADDDDDDGMKKTMAHLRAKIDATVVALGLTDEALEEKK